MSGTILLILFSLWLILRRLNIKYRTLDYLVIKLRVFVWRKRKKRILSIILGVWMILRRLKIKHRTLDYLVIKFRRFVRNKRKKRVDKKITKIKI